VKRKEHKNGTSDLFFFFCVEISMKNTFSNYFLQSTQMNELVQGIEELEFESVQRLWHELHECDPQVTEILGTTTIESCQEILQQNSKPKYFLLRMCLSFYSTNISEYNQFMAKYSRIHGVNSTISKYNSALHRRQGDIEQTIRELKYAMDRFPALARDVFILLEVGTCFRLVGKFAESLQYLNEAHSRFSNSSFVLKQRGATKRMLKDYSGAFEDLNMANQLHPNDSFTVSLLASVLRLSGRYSESREYFLKIHDGYHDGFFYYERALLFRELNEKDRVTNKHGVDYISNFRIIFADLNKAIELEPLEPLYVLEKAVTCFVFGSYWGVILALDKLFATASLLDKNMRAKSHFYRGLSYFYIGLIPEALSDLLKVEKLVENWPNDLFEKSMHLDTLGALAEVYLCDNNYKEFDVIVKEKMLQKYPDHYYAYYLKSCESRKRNSFVEAEGHIKKCFQLEKNHHDLDFLFNELALIKWATNNKWEALQQIKKAKRIFPSTYNKKMQAGLLGELCFYDKSIDILKKLLWDSKFNDTLIHFFLGKSYQAKGDLKRSASHLLHLFWCCSDGKRPEIFRLEFSRTLYLDRQFEYARSEILAISKESSVAFEAELLRGKIELEVRDISTAYSCFHNAAKLRPNSGEVWKEMGKLGRIHGLSIDNKDALRYYLKAVHLPDPNIDLFDMSFLMRMIGELEVSAKILKEISYRRKKLPSEWPSSFKRDNEYFTEKALICKQTGKLARADSYLNRMNAGREVDRERGFVAMFSGDLQSALKLFQKGSSVQQKICDTVIESLYIRMLQL
jgi:tetratricopeptide (TPR) repeat protein